MDHMLVQCMSSRQLFVVPFINGRVPQGPLRSPARAEVCAGAGAATRLCRQIDSFATANGERCTEGALLMNIDVLILDMSSRFMVIRRLPRTIKLLESLGRQLEVGVVSFEFTGFNVVGWSTGPNVGTLLIGTHTNDHKLAHINVIFSDAGYATVAQVEMLHGFGTVLDPWDVLSHALHRLDYSCGLGALWKINPCGLDLERKKIAGAFTTDHMLNFLALTRSSYINVPTFGLIHFFLNHEETQSGLGPLDGTLFSHLMGTTESMKNYLFRCNIHTSDGCC